jgi:hypothetical protein
MVAENADIEFVREEVNPVTFEIEMIEQGGSLVSEEPITTTR